MHSSDWRAECAETRRNAKSTENTKSARVRQRGRSPGNGQQWSAFHCICKNRYSGKTSYGARKIVCTTSPSRLVHAPSCMSLVSLLLAALRFDSREIARNPIRCADLVCARRCRSDISLVTVFHICSPSRSTHMASSDQKSVAATEPSQAIHIQRMDSGFVTSVTCPGDVKIVQDLKQQVQVQMGVQTGLQRLFFLGRELLDQEALAHAGIVNGVTVQLLLRRGAVAVATHRRTRQPVFTSCAQTFDLLESMFVDGRCLIVVAVVWVQSPQCCLSRTCRRLRKSRLTSEQATPNFPSTRRVGSELCVHLCCAA